MIQPVNPAVVYVPVYNPAVVYGYPYVVPAYVPPPASVAATAVVAFGVGIAVGAMMSNGCCAWGYSSWNCGWHGTTAVVYHGGAYYGNSAWHGGYYGSSASAYGVRLRARKQWLQPIHRNLRTRRHCHRLRHP